MNFGDQQPESLVGDPSLTGTVGHYFDMRTGDLVDTQFHLRQYFEDFQTATLSQIAIEFRGLHERLDGVEERLETARIMSPANVLSSKLTTIESKLNDILSPFQKEHQNLPASCLQAYETLTHTPTRQPFNGNPAKPTSGRNPTSNTLSAATPVSQLPSEESAKVKVLLRQFAANAMNSIEKNAFSFANVNNHVGGMLQIGLSMAIISC
ncbi:hypothetical protein K493DRAFT_110887 [Basidiobolus meristosporus CBS 931.73]|uniref:Uncharacterized protein n=1 Tax=Basidiobolus meristosporus CBS 931.73 TaxID=1314790 RepID=A0A1Y1YMU2_9FUNG|nr:hypothetical protein K493DRAFT_110887 [Basidiobolus meristosporus CBS 931.73]|eukprot:ORX99337.1 hypothetical protein K493DRAFT_110887 [Basidiobolus meristosporus CBS 931.73]